ncbi:MAG: hypothetical protein CMI59_00725 [Parvibaculum sp.]|nr:hypothetical protein [Parvibaculum sp.]
MGGAPSENFQCFGLPREIGDAVLRRVGAHLGGEHAFRIDLAPVILLFQLRSRLSGSELMGKTVFLRRMNSGVLVFFEGCGPFEL